MKKIFYIIALTLLASSCQQTRYSNYLYEDNQMMGMQNLYTRDVKNCPEYSQRCINNNRQMGYIPLQEKAMISAKYDELPLNRYPERRWRERNVVPRW